MSDWVVPVRLLSRLIALRLFRCSPHNCQGRSLWPSTSGFWDMIIYARKRQGGDKDDGRGWGVGDGVLGVGVLGCWGVGVLG